MRTATASFIALLLLACARADAPPPTDTASVETPAGVQMPPVVAPGDTGQRPAELSPQQPPGTSPPRSPARQPRDTPAAPTTRPPPSASVSDTIRGRAVLVGAAPMMQVVLRRTGEQDVILSGDGATMRALRSVQGLEIRAAGQREQNALRVARFAVRAADGVPAIDGRLEREGDHYILVSDDGRRHHIHHLPERLRERVGQRVWIAGSLDGEPEAFGVIEG